MNRLRYLLLVVCLYSTAAVCQLNKRTWIVGGDAGFNTSTYQVNSVVNTKTANLQLSGSVGYFVAPRLPVGIRISWQSKALKYDDPYGTTRQGHLTYRGTGLFARYYFLKRTDRPLNIVLDAHYWLGAVVSDLSLNVARFHRYTLAAGPVVYLNSRLGLELLLGYFREKTADPGKPTTGFQASLGLQIHLKKNKSSH